MKSRRAKNKSVSVLTTLFIVAVLIISGSAQAVQVVINTDDLNNRPVGETGSFYVNITIGDDEAITIANISVEDLPAIPGSPDGILVFNVSDFNSVGDSIVKGNYDISLIDRHNWTGGYGYGYGYGYGGSGAYTELKYKVTMDTTEAEPGTYTVTAKASTGQDIVFQGESSFTLIPSAIPLNIEIKPDRINPKSKGTIKVTVFNNTPAGFDVTSIDISSVRFGPGGAEVVESENPANKLVLKFRTEDTGIQCGDTQATMTGKTYDGQDITGTDSIATTGC